MTKLVEPKVSRRRRAGPGQAAVYQQLLDDGELEVQEFAEGESKTVKREGHMGITIVGGFIWPTWSRSRRVYPNRRRAETERNRVLMSDRTQTLLVEVDREHAEKLVEVPKTLTEPQAFAWGQAFDHLRRRCATALSQPEHQGEEDSRLLADMLEAWSSGIRRGEALEDTNANLCADDIVRAARLIRSQSPATVLSDEERERLGELADRIANDIEDEWPHAEEMRRHVRLLRTLASQEHRASGVSERLKLKALLFSDDAIEIAARKPSELAGSDQGFWDELDEEEKAVCRNEARQMLAAAWDRVTGHSFSLLDDDEPHEHRGEEEQCSCEAWAHPDWEGCSVHGKSGPSPQPPAGEVERLREPSDDLIRDFAHRLEDGSGSDLTYDEAAQWAISLLKWLADELHPSPSDSQGGRERCKRCGGSREIVHPPSKFDIEHGESRRWHESCPDCNPAPTQVEARLGYALAKKAMRKGQRVRAGLSLHRGDFEGVPISIEDDYLLLDPDGGVSVPRRLYWAELDRFEILPEQPEVPDQKGDEDDWPLATAVRSARGGEFFRIFVGEPGVGYTKDPERYEIRRYVPAPQDSSGLEERLKRVEHERDFDSGPALAEANAHTREAEDRASKVEAERDEARSALLKATSEVLASERDCAVKVLDALTASGLSASIRAFPRTDGSVAYGVWSGETFERAGIEKLLEIADSVPGMRLSFQGGQAHPLAQCVVFQMPPGGLKGGSK